MRRSRVEQVVFYANPVLTEPQRREVFGYLWSMTDRRLINGSNIHFYGSIPWNEMEACFGKDSPVIAGIIQARRTGKRIPPIGPHVRYTVIGPIDMLCLAKTDDEANKMGARFRLNHLLI